VLLLAALLVANPLYIYQHPDEINEVKVGNTYDRTPSANYTYEGLSSRAQELVRKAIEAEDNSTRFRGDHTRPKEFEFDRPTNESRDTAQTVYRVEYNGTNHTVTLVYHYATEFSRITVDEPTAQRPTANYTYAELSTRAQNVFRSALTAQNNTTKFQGDEKRPSEFSVPQQTGGSIVVGAVYRVEYNGTNYTIETFTPPRVTNTEARRSQALIAFGLILGVIGSLFVWREQPPKIGDKMDGLGFVFLVLNLGYRYAPDVFGWLTVFGSSIFIGLALLGGIVSAGYLVYKTNRERRFAQHR